MSSVPLGVYRHYKNNLYEVVGVARHSETFEELVVYRALYNSEEFGKDTLWVRPKEMFLESVIVDGKTIPRFQPVNFTRNEKVSGRKEE